MIKATEKPMIRVCLVDDQTLVRQGIRSLLALDDGIEVVAEASDGKQAVEVIPEAAPDVVLMDMRMPLMSGLEALQLLSRENRLPPTIILTTFDDDQLVLAGLKAGAKGYLLKDVSLEQLVGAIRTVAGCTSACCRAWNTCAMNSSVSTVLIRSPTVRPRSCG